MEKEIRRKPVESMKLREAIEAGQDICAIKMPYLTHQEELIHETGFVGFYTQQEHAGNWFHIKRINGLEDMLFSSQRWPDLPYLEDQEHIICQAKYWRPGDFVLLLEALHRPLRSTSTHWIRRILEEFIQIKPELNMEDWIIVWFDHYQTKIWRPGDILHLPEELEDILRAFKSQHTKRRRIWSSLPYLDSSNILFKDLQRLFPSFLRALKTYSVCQDIPRRHQFMPKLSRLKKSHLFSQIPQTTPTASFASFLFISFILSTI